MFRFMGANIRLDTLHDYLYRECNLYVECVCGRVAVVDVSKFARWCLLKRINADIGVCKLHLRCVGCRKKGRIVRYRATMEKPTNPNWMSSERDWYALHRRLRG